jgi:hypothetical protein
MQSVSNPLRGSAVIQLRARDASSFSTEDQDGIRARREEPRPPRRRREKVFHKAYRAAVRASQEDKGTWQKESREVYRKLGDAAVALEDEPENDDLNQHFLDQFADHDVFQTALQGGAPFSRRLRELSQRHDVDIDGNDEESDGEWFDDDDADNWPHHYEEGDDWQFDDAGQPAPREAEAAAKLSPQHAAESSPAPKPNKRGKKSAPGDADADKRPRRRLRRHEQGADDDRSQVDDAGQPAPQRAAESSPAPKPNKRGEKPAPSERPKRRKAWDPLEMADAAPDLSPRVEEPPPAPKPNKRGKPAREADAAAELSPQHAAESSPAPKPNKRGKKSAPGDADADKRPRRRLRRHEQGADDDRSQVDDAGQPAPREAEAAAESSPAPKPNKRGEKPAPSERPKRRKAWDPLEMADAAPDLSPQRAAEPSPAPKPNKRGDKPAPSERPKRSKAWFPAAMNHYHRFEPKGGLQHFTNNLGTSPATASTKNLLDAISKH